MNDPPEDVQRETTRVAGALCADAAVRLGGILA
jgi:hypothetical protein